MHDLPRQLSVEELTGLFEGPTRLVHVLAEREDPLGRARAVLDELPEEDRVEALDGRLHVESPPGRGTRIRVEIPCG